MIILEDSRQQIWDGDKHRNIHRYCEQTGIQIIRQKLPYGDYAIAMEDENGIVYENLVRLEYERQCHGIYFEKDVPVAVEVRAYYQIPKSVSKKRTKTMLSGETRPLKRPDTDNVLKSILDAMNGFAFYDDSQVTDISASKYYSDAPRVEVTVKEVVYE